MRHLAVAEPCPIDRRAVGRRACSECTHFVSFRSSAELDTIGCSWGEDTIDWLRREMTPLAARHVTADRSTTGRIVRRPGAVPVRTSDGTALAVVAAAVGIGLLLSAMNRRPAQPPLLGRVIQH